MVVDKKPKHPKKERKNFAFGISLSEFITSIAVGIGSGVATAITKVRVLFYDDAKAATAFHHHFYGDKKIEDVEYGPRALGRQDRLDAIDLQDMLAEGKTKADYQKAIHAEKRILKEEFDGIALLRRGIRKNSILGSIDKFKLLGANSKRNLYGTSAAGAVIGAVMTLGFFNGVATRDKIERIEDAVSADPSQQKGR